MEPKALILALASLILAITDARLTDRAIKMGRREANKFLARLLGARPKLGVAIAWRVGAWAVLLWFSELIAPTIRLGQHYALAPMPWYGWLVLVAAQLYVVLETERTVGSR